jgi:hypothetical protein
MVSWPPNAVNNPRRSPETRSAHQEAREGGRVQLPSTPTDQGDEEVMRLEEGTRGMPKFLCPVCGGLHRGRPDSCLCGLMWRTMWRFT